ncbi:MAG: hypothetical protein OEV99_07310 [Nitrospira sp.]|nr:hypothetical protein [Nitrospira sp.]MDH5193169.1 hypothetical protein [Nitrospira sp.]
MATDVKLDEIDGTYLLLEARVVKSVASDFMLDSPERNKGINPHRRALVHDQSDGLTINYNGDYPGGVRINQVAELTPLGRVKMGPSSTIKMGGMKRIEGEQVIIDTEKMTIKETIAIPHLVVRGGISFETYGEKNARVTFSLGEVLASLKEQISELNTKVAALEKK